MNKTIREFIKSDEFKKSLAIGRIIKRNLPGENVGRMKSANMDLVLGRDFHRKENSLRKSGTTEYYRQKLEATERNFESLIIRNSYSVALRKSNRAAGGGQKSEKSRENLNSGFYSNGTISRSTQKKIRNIGELWSNAVFAANVEYHNAYARQLRRKYARFLTFITLTMPGEQRHTDHYIKKVFLNNFLTWIQRKGAAHYMWRAEAQANGMIHFHIITDVFLHYKAVKSYWNNILEQHGYKGDSNGTRIEGIKGDGLQSYIAKYIAKNEKEKKARTKNLYFAPDRAEQKYKNGIRLINGRLWGCSRDLAAKFTNRVIQHLRISLSKYWAYIEDISNGMQKDKDSIQEQFFSVFGNRIDIFSPKNIYSIAVYYAFLVNARHNFNLLYDT